MVHALVRMFCHLLLLPMKVLLLIKLHRTRAAAAAATYASPIPGMRVEGSPPVRLTGQPSPSQVLDFVTWRSPMYIPEMTGRTADRLADVLTGRADVKPATAAFLNHAMVHTPSGYIAEKHEGRWVLDFRKVALFPHRKVTLATYAFLPGSDEAEITDTDGNTYRPGDPLYSTALQIAGSWWSIYVVAGLHNWVHFELPDTMAEAHTRLTRPGSFLGRLVAPHVRFTSRINYAGLWLNQSTHNPDDALRPLRLWAGPPFLAEDFQRGIVENTGRQYADLPAHFAMADTLDGEVPYLAGLKAYFPPFLRFTERIDGFIDDADWEELVTTLEGALPGIRAIPRPRMLAAFMWQVSVVHGSDHISFATLATDYLSFWPPETMARHFGAADVSRLDRWKSLNTMEVFIKYRANPALANHLVDVGNYGFEGEAAQAALDFRHDLRTVAADLERRGLLVVGPEGLPQSVCF